MSFEVYTKDQVKNAVTSPNHLVIDVRSPIIYWGRAKTRLAGHIQGAHNLPLEAMQQDPDEAINQLKSWGMTDQTKVVVYCNHGITSLQAAQWMSQMMDIDQRQIKNYQGSMADWITTEPAVITEPDNNQS